MTAAPVSWCSEHRAILDGYCPWCLPGRDEGDDAPAVEETVAKVPAPPWAHAQGVRHRIARFQEMQGAKGPPALPPIEGEELLAAVDLDRAHLELALVHRRSTVLATVRLNGPRAVFSAGAARRAARAFDLLADRVDAERARLRAARVGGAR